MDGQTTWFDTDFSNRAALARALEAVDVVFHLLGVSVPAKSDADAERDLIDGVARHLSFLSACSDAWVSRLVFCSSGGAVYGRQPHMPIAETVLPQPLSAYGVNKLTLEHYLRVEHTRSGLDYRVLRVANAYGPGQQARRGQGVVATLMDRMLRGAPVEVWGDGSATRDYVYIDDVVDAFIRAAGYDGPHRTFNIGAGVGRSVVDVIDGVAQALEISPGRIQYKDGRAADVPHNVLDISLAARELGWRPQVSWEAGLARTAAWMQRDLAEPLTLAEGAEAV